jgi:hypothetical protein
MRDARQVLLTAAALVVGVMLLMDGIEGVRSVRSPSTAYEAVVTESRHEVRTVRQDGRRKTVTSIWVVFDFDGRQQTLRQPEVQRHFQRGDRAVIEVSDDTGRIVEVRDGAFSYRAQTLGMSLALGGAGSALLLAAATVSVAAVRRARRSGPRVTTDGPGRASPSGKGPSGPAPGEPWGAVPTARQAVLDVLHHAPDPSEPVWWRTTKTRSRHRAVGIGIIVIGIGLLVATVGFAIVVDDALNRTLGTASVGLLGILTVGTGSQRVGSASPFGPLWICLEAGGYAQGETAALRVRQHVDRPIRGRVSVGAEVRLSVSARHMSPDTSASQRRADDPDDIVAVRTAAVHHWAHDEVVEAELLVPIPTLPPPDDRSGDLTSSPVSVAITVRVDQAIQTSVLALPLRHAPHHSTSSAPQLGPGWAAVPPPVMAGA